MNDVAGDDVLGPIQLQDAYLYDAKVSREASPEGDDERPVLDPKVRGWTLAEDHFSLVVVLGATIRHRFRPEAIANLDISVAGHFVSQAPIDEETARNFATVNGLLLLWPYLRAYAATLSAAMQVDLPTLPVIDTSALLEIVAKRQSPADSRAAHDR